MRKYDAKNSGVYTQLHNFFLFTKNIKDRIVFLFAVLACYGFAAITGIHRKQNNITKHKNVIKYERKGSGSNRKIERR